MGQVRGTVRHSDRSLASGRRISGLATGVLGGMIGPTTTDSRGRFTLTWSSSATGLAKIYVDGNEYPGARDGDDVDIDL